MNATQLIPYMMHNQKFQPAIETLGLGQLNPDNPMNKVQTYHIGVMLLEHEKKQNLDSHKNSMFFFNCAIELDKYYFQAYTRLGDCYFDFDYKKALSYYKKSLECITKSKDYDERQISLNTQIKYSIINYIRDNYLKIGICYHNLNNSEKGLYFVLKAQNLSSEEYDFSDLGFKDWNSLIMAIKKV